MFAFGTGTYYLPVSPGDPEQALLPAYDGTSTASFDGATPVDSGSNASVSYGDGELTLDQQGWYIAVCNITLGFPDVLLPAPGYVRLQAWYNDAVVADQCWQFGLETEEDFAGFDGDNTLEDTFQGIWTLQLTALVYSSGEEDDALFYVNGMSGGVFAEGESPSGPQVIEGNLAVKFIGGLG